MSQRSSFTSEYIYCDEDYESIKKAAKEWGNGKYLCFAPPAKWGDNEMPIIQGKVGELYPTGEARTLREFMDTFEVKHNVTFIILPESHDFKEAPTPIIKLTKYPNGDVFRTDYKGIDKDNEYIYY